mgnify:CR=1 FL=1
MTAETVIGATPLPLADMADPEQVMAGYGDGAARPQVIDEFGKPVAEQPDDAGHQRMGVPSLRNASSHGRFLGQAVAFEDCHLVEVVAQDPRGRQARDARADDDGPAAAAPAHPYPLRPRPGPGAGGGGQGGEGGSVEVGGGASAECTPQPGVTPGPDWICVTEVSGRVIDESDAPVSGVLLSVCGPGGCEPADSEPRHHVSPFARDGTSRNIRRKSSRVETDRGSPSSERGGSSG